MLIHFDSKMLVVECQDIITTSWHSNQTLQFPKWSDQDQSEENTTNCPFPLPIRTTWHRSPRTSLNNGFISQMLSETKQTRRKIELMVEFPNAFYLRGVLTQRAGERLRSRSVPHWPSKGLSCQESGMSHEVSSLTSAAFRSVVNLTLQEISAFDMSMIVTIKVPACSHVLPVLLK